MKIIRTKYVRLFQAAAITAFPFIFIDPDCFTYEITLKHEKIHYNQQKKWAIYGLGVGLLAWFLLYLLVLPVGWNPFRRKWETEAFRSAEKYSTSWINKILREPPYYLWW